MKDQVTSIEQSKRLIELGVPAEKASMAWIDPLDTNEYILTSKLRHFYPGEQDIAAFTVSDLLEIIPKTITDGRGIVYKLNIEICSSTNHCWCVYWGDNERQIGWQDRISILNALEDAIEWIVITGRKLNL